MPNEQPQVQGPEQTAIVRKEDLLETLVQGMPPREATAFATLVRGGSVVLAAKRAGVDRATVYRWLEPGTAFSESMRRWKGDLADTTRTRMLMLAEGASEVLQDAIGRGDVRVALKIVEGLGILAPPPVGPTNEELRAENLRLKNAQQQRAEDVHADVENFLAGRPSEPATPLQSFAGHRSAAQEGRSPKTRPAA